MHAKSPAYFGTWSGYRIPFQPREPISQEEAEGRESYYVAYYDDQDQLARFEKYLNGRLEWEDEYEYWDNGKLKARRMRKADGSQTHQQFDRRGRIIQEPSAG